MNDLGRPSSKQRLEQWVHFTLLAGVVISGILLAAGLILLFAQGQPRPPTPPPALALLLSGALRGNGLAIIYFGLLLLIATPLLRVAVLALGWAIERDRTFAAVAFVVLCLLALSLALGVG